MMPWIVLFLMLLTSAVIDIMSWETFRAVMEWYAPVVVLSGLAACYYFAIFGKGRG
jgi:hypothetical protein